MNFLDLVTRRWVARRRSPLTRKTPVLVVALAVALLAGALAMVALPPTTADAAARLSLLCEPEEEPEKSGPNLARPRAVTTGKDVNGGDLVPGDEILWTVTVKNLGDKLTKIFITDIVPEWTTYVDGSIEGPGANDSGVPTLTWSVDSLKCGERVTVSFRSRVDDGVPAGTLISNWASADCAQTPPGVSDAVTLKVADSSEESAVKPSASSSPTAVAGLEMAEGDDTSEGANGASGAGAEASGDSSETATPPSSSESALAESTIDDSGLAAAVVSDDGDGWKLGVGLGVGLGVLALIGGIVGLIKWRANSASGN